MTTRTSGHIEGAPEGTTAWLQDLPRLVDQADDSQVVYRGRNLLVKLTFSDKEWVIKRFRQPGPIAGVGNRWRGSKAQRSFIVACTLKDQGIHTPHPLGWADDPSGHSFFACAYENRLQVREYHEKSYHNRELWIAALGRYAGLLHEAGILHKDFTVGNILFDPNENPEDEHTTFSLVDLNRCRIGAVSADDGIANIVKLEQQGSDGDLLVSAYCSARGLDVSQHNQRYHRLLNKHLRWFEMKNATRPWRRKLNPFRKG